jgi:23S rRNA (uridine2552-2'-O)-methyltransferase
MRQIATRVKTAKRRKISSTRWLQRQLNDEYVLLANKHGYKSRAAYKLKEINDKYHLIKPSTNALDLGAAPGGWSQVLSEVIKSKGGIISLDLLEMEEIPGVIVLQGDFCDENIVQKLKTLQKKTDLILSDMAPNTTGHKQTDHIRIIDLCERVFLFAKDVLSDGGSVVVKIFQGGAQNELLNMVKQDFKEVKHFKPPASRKDSTEMYLIAIGYKGSSLDGN